MTGLRRALLVGLVTLVAADLALWGAHVVWRSSALVELRPVAEQAAKLAEQLAEDDRWLEVNAGLMQEYGQPARFAARAQARARRTAAHRALVDAYNEQVTRLYRRFYLAPVPAPRPPTLPHLDT